jgi:hypothetical protein
MLLFELFGPLVEILAYIFICVLAFQGVIPLSFIAMIFGISIFFGTLITINSILVQEILYQIYRNPRYIALMIIIALFENFGYRQLNMCWRVIGLWRWFRGRQSVWGEMRRSADWDKDNTRDIHVILPASEGEIAVLPTIEQQAFNPHHLHFDPHFDPSRFAGRVLG